MTARDYPANEAGRPVLGVDPDGRGAAVLRDPSGVVLWWGWWSASPGWTDAGFTARGGSRAVRMPDLVDVGMAIAGCVLPLDPAGIVVEGLFASGADSLILAGRKALLLTGIRRGGLRAPILAEPPAVGRGAVRGLGWRAVVLGLPDSTRADVAERRAVDVAMAAGALPKGIPNAAAQGAIAEAWCMAAYPDRLAARAAKEVA